MIITNCPRCGAMNATTTCNECGWSQVTISTVSTRITGEIEIMLSGKALLDDYKRLLLENRNLKERIAELEAERRWVPVSERLPDKNDTVLVFSANESDSSPAIAVFYDCEWTEWIVNSRFLKSSDVTHWMPLPQPPEGA